MDVRTQKRHFSCGNPRGGLLLASAMILLITALFGACKTDSGNDSANPPKETEKRTETVVSWLITSAPKGEIDTVPAMIREYIALATEAYASGDYSVSVKREMSGAWPEAEGTQFAITIHDPEGVASTTYRFAIVLSETPDFENPRVVSVDPNRRRSMKIGNFKTGATYYWYARAEAPDGTLVKSPVAQFTTTPGPRLLVIPGVENARDLGNWSGDTEGGIVQGLIYRSGKLESGGEDAVNVLVNELGIRTEIDFRNPDEEFVRSFLPADRVTILVDPIGYYADFIRDPERSVNSFRLLTRPDAYPVIFHCKAGADRTGSFAFILEALAGRTEVERILDYELTGSRYVNADDDSEAEGYDFELLLKAFAELPGETDADKARYFLTAAGLNPMEIRNLEAILSGHGAVLKDPSTAHYSAENQAVVFEIETRDAGKPVAVTVNGKDAAFTFNDGVLSFPGGESGEGTVQFEDGSELVLKWE